MGKSPGKWIKTILFGKKTSKSNFSKGRHASKTSNEKETWVAAKEPTTDFPVDPPLISEPTPGSTNRNVDYSVLEKGISPNLPHDEVVLLPGNQDTDKQGTTRSITLDDPEIIRLEQAATKAQAAFRGYLARRAFRALRGIIRLQALIRGHLVRRQAVATLRCMQGIVKFQSVVRGRRVRLSDSGFEVKNKCSVRKPLDAKHSGTIEVNRSTRTEKLLANTFVSKLLRTSPTAMPLHLQYGLKEPESAWNWLERWTYSHFWEPLPQPKKVVDSKSQTRQGSFQSVETEPSRSKRTVRRVPAANVDNSSILSTSETERPKRNPRKVTSHPVDPVHEHSQNELEKVKRNLRKVSNPTLESTDHRLEVETEKPKRSLKKASSSPAPDALDQGTCDPTEKMKKDFTVAVSKEPDAETTSTLFTTDKPLALHHDHSPVELPTLDCTGKDKDIRAKNEDSFSKEDQTSCENHKSNRRRSSFPAKQENLENGLQSSPALPSYMAATESAKAKLRAQGSPRFSQDGAEKNGFTRRHSLPSSTNGKLSSLSPQTQRPFQASGKGTKSEKSLLSSRDGSEKVVQAEWRR